MKSEARFAQNDLHAFPEALQGSHETLQGSHDTLNSIHVIFEYNIN